MKTIYKYVCDVTKDFPDMHKGAKVLLVQYVPTTMRPQEVGVWVECDISKPLVPVTNWQWLGTGHPLPDDMVHLGSTVAEPFVWHLYGL